MARIKKYRERKYKTIYGRESEISMLRFRWRRYATIYPNAHLVDGKTYGVQVQGELSYHKGGTLSNQRWQGGLCLGFNFSYKQARKLAIDFVVRNKLPKFIRSHQ